MKNMDYIIERLAERSGIPGAVMALITYAGIVAVTIGALVALKYKGWI